MTRERVIQDDGKGSDVHAGAADAPEVANSHQKWRRFENHRMDLIVLVQDGGSEAFVASFAHQLHRH